MEKSSLNWRSSSRLAGIGVVTAAALLLLAPEGPSASPANASAGSDAPAFENARVPCPPSEPRLVPADGMDFNIDFAPDSFALTLNSEPILNDLSNAMNSEQLSGFQFAAIAHIETLGDKASEERATVLMATAVIGYLVNEGGVDPTRLVWAACGALQPSDVRSPGSGDNRRVEIVNMGAR